jgi:NAD(P)-dependent dehydrogenase (short-subunit alcohol dehydrogenase family)
VAGSTALVTGADGGIGGETARTLAAAGAAVALVGLSEGALERVAKEIDGRTIVVVADLADPDAARAAVNRAVSELGGVQVVVNAAGILRPRLLGEFERRDWDDTLAVNLSGAFWVAREAGLWMARNGGGCIVNIASEVALRGASGHAAYCASKAGLIGLTKALAIELAPDVRVNAISPGAVNTPMMYATAEADPEQVLREAGQVVPLGRVGEPSDIARAIMFLVADAGYVTGTVLSLDGGTSAASYWESLGQ